MSSRDRLRVLTINIWNRSGPWEQRLVVLRRAVAALEPDVIALQEVLSFDGMPKDQADEIGEGLGYQKAYGPATVIGGGLHLGNAVLSHFPIAATHRFELPNAGDVETRAVLGVELTSPWGRLPFFVTHLNWQPDHGHIRQRQVAAITSFIDEVCAASDPDRFPAVLAGDLNAEPASDEIRFLQGWHAIEGRSVYYLDAFHLAGRGAGETFAPSRNHFAAVSHEPDRRIDYVFVRGRDVRGRGRPLAARVVLDHPDEGVFASDHFGVFAELSTGHGGA